MATLTNISLTGSSFSNLEARVARLTSGNRILLPNGRKAGSGSKFTIARTDEYADGILDSEEFVNVPFAIYVAQDAPFDLAVKLLSGVPSGNAALAGPPFPPTDVSLFTRRVYSNAPPTGPAQGPRLTEEQLVALVKKQGALAVYNDPVIQQIIS